MKLLSIIIENSRPKYISIPTNGWYIERTSEAMNRILRKYPNIFFSLYFSIDGHEEVHDEIRGENSYKRVRETYFKLKNLNASYSEKLYNLNEHNNFLIDRIKRLQPNSLDLDYLEEKLRKNTGFSKNKEIIIVFD